MKRSSGYARGREARRSKVGTPTQDSEFEIRQGLQAQVDLKRLGRNPHAVSHNHKRNIRDHIDDDTAKIEARFVLMEYNEDGNKQLKWRMMTRLEAWKRNENLRGTGFAWALCGNDTRI